MICLFLCLFNIYLHNSARRDTLFFCSLLCFHWVTQCLIKSTQIIRWKNKSYFMAVWHYNLQVFWEVSLGMEWRTEIRKTQTSTHLLSLLFHNHMFLCSRQISTEAIWEKAVSLFSCIHNPISVPHLWNGDTSSLPSVWGHASRSLKRHSYPRL